jgi:uncharacterized protein (TIGR03067 family)
MNTVFRLSAACVLIAWALQGALLVDDDAKTKYTALTGKWKVVKVHYDGKEVTLDDVSGLNDEVEFKDSLVIGMLSGDKAATTELDVLAGNPPRFRRRSVGAEKLVVGKGIFKIDKDTLYWCEVLFADANPDAFKTTKGDKRTLIVLKRTSDT